MCHCAFIQLVESSLCHHFWRLKTMTNNHKCTSGALNSSMIHVWLSHHKSTQPNMHCIDIPLLHAHSHRYWTQNMEEKATTKYSSHPNKITHSILYLLTLAAVHTSAYLSTHTVYQYKIHYFGDIWPYWKMDRGKHNFHEILFLSVTIPPIWRLKNCWTSSQHTPSPNVHWLAHWLQISLPMRFLSLVQ